VGRTLGSVSVLLLPLLLVAGCAYGIRGLADDDDVLGRWNGEAMPFEPGSTGTATGLSTTSTAGATTGSTTTTSYPTTGSATGSSCDNTGDCSSCANCSTAGECGVAADGCFYDDDCNSFVGCLGGCSEESCFDGCVSLHATGYKLYLILVECAFCDACPVDCAADSQGLCSP
jgi:hypothetical protein